uniref:Pyrin domain-containing protein n=1 Tax=Dicentrarchus labrax TaxID=13489 RepID=A0A8C4FBQ9_DICLA
CVRKVSILLGSLEDLVAEEFKKFKWYLQQSEVLEGFPAIPKGRLENADRVDTVDQMVQTYCIHKHLLMLLLLLDDHPVLGSESALR